MDNRPFLSGYCSHYILHGLINSRQNTMLKYPFKEKSISELARELIKLKPEESTTSSAIRTLMQNPAFPPPQNNLALPPAIPAAITLPAYLPPPKDLKSPLTKKWNSSLHRAIQDRLKQKTKLNIRRIRDIKDGFTMPELTSVAIGSAKRMEAAILFFDLENFTVNSSKISNEHVLYMLNMIIPEIMFIINHWKGEIEKNTGDGVMAIFGTETRNSFLIARDTIEAAMTIQYVMLNDIQPKLSADGLPHMNFRIGIDMGDVLISRIGVKNANFLTIVGAAANRASKLQNISNSNGICIGENLYKNISQLLCSFCTEGKHDEWKWHYPDTKQPYRFFHYGFEWPDPREWFKIKL
jgi:class 3 adenylate cyclase